jgi:hypothetical protein
VNLYKSAAVILGWREYLHSTSAAINSNKMRITQIQLLISKTEVHELENQSNHQVHVTS